MADATPEVLADWCNTLGPFLPGKTREGLRESILQRTIDGYTFSALVNQHNELLNIGVSGLTLAMATKIRKCWHRDFPQAASIRATDTPLPSSRSNAFQPPDEEDRGMDLSRRHSFDSGRSGAGVIHGDSQWQASSPRRPGGMDAISEASGPAAVSGGIGTSGMEARSARRGSNSEAGQVELLRSALDCVAERAGLERQEMYLWVHSVIPNEIWQPLWDGVTADLLRQQREPSAPSQPTQAGRGSAASFPGNSAVPAMQRAMLEEDVQQMTPLLPTVGREHRRNGPPSTAGSYCDSPGAYPAAMSQRSPDGMYPEPGNAAAAALAAARDLDCIPVHRRPAATPPPQAHYPPEAWGPPEESGASWSPQKFEEPRRGPPEEPAAARSPQEHRRGPPDEPAFAWGTQDIKSAAPWGPQDFEELRRGPAEEPESRPPRRQDLEEHAPQFSRGRSGFPGNAGRSPRDFKDSPRGGAAPSECGSFAVTERSLAAPSEAESVASQAMSAWLETEYESAPCLSPLELAEWLRTLPSGRLPEENRKAVARRVLDEEIDGKRFGQLLEDGKWSELSVADDRDAGMFLRFFKSRQREAMMAEAARQSAALNQSLKGMKGEMLTV